MRRSIANILFIFAAFWLNLILIINLFGNLSKIQQLIIENEKLNRVSNINKEAIERSEQKLVELNRTLFSRLIQFEALEQHVKAREKEIQYSETDLEAQNQESPGEMGKPVYLDKDKLNSREREKYELSWKHNYFNEYVSDMISLYRTLPDIRDPECKQLKWFYPLPPVSVIIIFYNEALSVLLRTVYSVIDRSNPDTLYEVILVDDSSTFTNLHEKLQEYVVRLAKVRLVRNKKREGLIRARLKGADEATGEILVFLDSHCEVTEGWLEPLIDPIARNPNVSTVPVVEIIDHTTFQFKNSSIESIQVGGFDWSLMHKWRKVPEYEIKRRKFRTDPIRSPTMAGGLFAINKKYFELIGRYDPQMDIWGGENMEISFKIWMCGGELVFTPCSHVGHIYREVIPYSFPSETDVVKKNTFRVAEVWLDEYKEFHYERFSDNRTLEFIGDLRERKALREQLQCQTFDWYVKNVYPEIFIPSEAIYYGEIRNKGESEYCLDSNSDDGYKPVLAYKCQGQSQNQLWMMSKQGQILRDEICLDVYSAENIYTGKKNQVYTFQCDNVSTQNWTFDVDIIRHQDSQHCLELSQDKEEIILRKCDSNTTRQKWMWNKRENKKFATYV